MGARGRNEQMKLVKELRRQGFTVERTGSGHWKVTRDGVDGSVVMAFSPSSKPQHKTLKRLEALGFQR